MRYVCFYVLCFVLSLSACTKKAEQREMGHDPSLAKVIVKKALTIGVDPSVPPLSFYGSNGQIVGYEIDVAREIAAKLGVDLRIIPVTSENRFEKLENRTIDYLASGFAITHDSVEIALSQPYLRDALVVAVFDSIVTDSALHEFADLKNRRIGMISDKDIVEITKHSPLYVDNPFDPVLYQHSEQLLTALDYGELDGVVMNLLTYFSKITKEKKRYRIIGDPILIRTYSYAFRKEDQQLRTTVDAILNDLAKDSTLRTISNKWFGADVSIIGKY